MKPSVDLCDKIRCPKFWPWDHRCKVFGKLPGHMDHCPEGLLNSYEECVEQLASIEHRQWAHWTKYMLENMTPENVARWQKQIKKPYSQLSEKEKESDRKWARKVVDFMLKTNMASINIVEE